MGGGSCGRGRGEGGRGGGWRAGRRLQPNFNEHRGEYPLFFFFLFFLFFFSRGLLLARRSKSLSHKQGISHHALGFYFGWWGGLGNCVILRRTCSAVLIEQMICQFVMFIFREARRRRRPALLSSAQRPPTPPQQQHPPTHQTPPPQNTVQMLAGLSPPTSPPLPSLTDLVVITE